MTEFRRALEELTSFAAVDHFMGKWHLNQNNCCKIDNEGTVRDGLQRELLRRTVSETLRATADALDRSAELNEAAGLGAAARIMKAEAILLRDSAREIIS